MEEEAAMRAAMEAAEAAEEAERREREEEAAAGPLGINRHLANAGAGLKGLGDGVARQFVEAGAAMQQMLEWWTPRPAAKQPPRPTW